jgi:ketosteroid isomerase-like protein
MMRYGLAGALFIVPTFGCAPRPGVDLTAERAALREAMEAYHEAASTKDAQTVVSMYDDEAMMIPPNAERVEGIEGIRSYRFGFIENAGVELNFETMRVEIAAGGDMAWTLAVANASFDGPDGEPGSDRIRDFHVWKKQADGSWKVEVDIWNSGLPAQ